MLLFTHYLHTHVCITYSCTRIRIQVAHTYFNGYQNSVITPFRLFRFHFSGGQLLLTNCPSPLSFHSQLEHSHPLSLARYSFDIHSIVIIKRSQLDTLTVVSNPCYGHTGHIGRCVVIVIVVVSTRASAIAFVIRPSLVTRSRHSRCRISRHRHAEFIVASSSNSNAC
jgi:hypothetical protein